MHAVKLWGGRLAFEIGAGVFVGLVIFLIYVCSVQSISFIYQGY